MENVDYVIVGGGTAGCILANRLSASGKYRVLLLEAGGAKEHFWVSVPAGFSKLLTHQQHNWSFRTTPEPNTLNRVIAVPRGKGLGGSTLINGMIYVRGQPEDYDYWAEQGARGWSHQEVEPYFKKLEQYCGQSVGRGHDGPMHITEVQERHPLAQAFIRAGQQYGLPLNPDYNVGHQDGVGYYQVLQYQGRRWSAKDGYLNPALKRKNLIVLSQAHVLRLNLTAQNHCQSVTFIHQGKTKTVQAHKEVILAAGAVQSPQILELSGIGDAALLQRYGVAVQFHCPSVGENYIDHFCTRMNWRVKGANSLNELTRGWHLARAVARYACSRTGILTLGTGMAFGFVKSHPQLLRPDVQYFFMHASYANAAERKLDTLPGMTLGVAQLRPKSIGSIHIQSADPFVQPAIKPNFLAERQDQQSLIGGMQVARQIMDQPAMRDFIEQETSPGDHVQSHEQWLHYARENGQSIYHPIGTCKMGDDEQAVVDPTLRFKGISGLRIVDASVMPSMVSGNTQAAVMMIAEKGADLILADR